VFSNSYRNTRLLQCIFTRMFVVPLPAANDMATRALPVNAFFMYALLTVLLGCVGPCQPDNKAFDQNNGWFFVSIALAGGFAKAIDHVCCR
jgi:hypothetical protein